MVDLTNMFPKGKIRKVFTDMDKVIAQAGNNISTIALKKDDYEVLLNGVNQRDRQYGVTYRGRRVIPYQT